MTQPPREKTIQSKVIRFLKRLRAHERDAGRDLWFHKQHGGPFGHAGVPDILLFFRGQFFGLEVKRPTAGSEPTALQQRHLEWIDNVPDGHAAVVRSVEDVERTLAAVQYRGYPSYEPGETP